jgi:hypothetical protein
MGGERPCFGGRPGSALKSSKPVEALVALVDYFFTGTMPSELMSITYW